MAELNGINGLQPVPEATYTKPRTTMEYLKGLRSRFIQDSVMEPGFMDSIMKPMNTDNAESTLGGIVGALGVEDLVNFANNMDKGMKGEINRNDWTIGQQLNFITVGLEAVSGRLLAKGNGFDPNRVNMLVGPKAKDIIKADKMVRRGASPAEIQSKLLMHKKPDGMWRKDISDAGKSLDPDKISEISQDFFYGGKTAAVEFSKELESEGVKYINAYHVTKNKISELSKGIETGPGHYNREESVYFFLDKDDIERATPYLSTLSGDKLEVMKIRIPAPDVKYMQTDSIFNGSFDTYSAFSIPKKIDPENIISSETIKVLTPEEYRRIYEPNNNH